MVKTSMSRIQFEKRVRSPIFTTRILPNKVLPDITMEAVRVRGRTRSVKYLKPSILQPIFAGYLNNSLHRKYNIHSINVNDNNEVSKTVRVLKSPIIKAVNGIRVSPFFNTLETTGVKRPFINYRKKLIQ